MKFNQQYKVIKPEYKINYKAKEYKDKETNTVMKENTAKIEVELKEVKDLYNEIQANREGTELRIQILKQQMDINKLTQEGTYLNNETPIDLANLAKLQQEYKIKLEQMKNEALKEKLEKEQKPQETQEKGETK